jgi:amidohydrolase
MSTATRSDLGVLRERVKDAIAKERNHVVEVAETIRQNPEIGYQEFMASQLMADHLKEAGYEVEKPYGGLETAFRATKRSGKPGPTVAVLAEYDALKGIGHGCGHNLIAGSGLATAFGIASVINEVGGNFVVIGTPAEEGGAGKVKLMDAGAFEDIDAALMIHHAGDTTGAPLQWPDGTCLAVAHMDFEYFGKPAHSAADPYNGVNALNAVIKLFTGIDAMRQHVHMESRIHGIITHGGDAANVVPKYASARMYVRAASRDYLEELVRRVTDIANGAALMTGCEVKITEDNTCFDMRPNYTLGRRYHENMKEVGLDLSHAREGRGMHSTDFGNVSYKVPSVTGSFAISHEPIPGHSQQVVDASGSDYGYEQFLKASTAMALTALDILTDPQLSIKAWDEHRNWDKINVKG